jgi:hypothetical protein
MVPLGACEEMGSNQPARSNKLRTTIVGSALTLSMIVAVAFVAKDYWAASAGPVADLQVSPEVKLKGLVVSLAEHSTTMSLAEMESKLDAWRKNPSTLLDMPEDERMQVS